MQKAELITNRKRRGEWAEMYFMTCAAERGLHVSRPYGDSDHFDFIIGDHGCLLRVQVKSTLSRWMKGYGCNVRATRSRRYAPDDYDFLAVLVIPRQVWYIIPAELATRRAKLLLSPDLPNSKYEPYRDAWHLLCPRACVLRGMDSLSDLADAGRP